MKVKVRVCETDLLGHINHKSYFDYIDESISHFFLEHNIGIELPNTFILAKVSCEFLAQGYFGQTLRLRSFPIEVGTKSVTFVTHIINDGDDKLIAKGESVLVYFNSELKETLLIPHDIKEILNEYRGDLDD